MTTTVLLGGCLVGLGVWIVISGWWPAPESLSVALQRLEKNTNDQESVLLPLEGERDRDVRFGAWLVNHVPPLARAVERISTDLRILGITPEEHVARVGAYVGLALFAGPWMMLMSRLAGMGVPPILPLLISCIGAIWGLITPFTRLRRAAAVRRHMFRAALSAWCDVTVMALASGRGVEQAMETGAAAGDGWAFQELRGALGAAYVRGEPPWVGLSELARQLGVKDLAELSSTMSMAGDEGAAVRETLTAKSRTIRERRTAETEQNAASSTEKMSLPAVLVVFGFMIFLGFPTVVVFFEGLG